MSIATEPTSDKSAVGSASIIEDMNAAFDELEKATPVDDKSAVEPAAKSGADELDDELEKKLKADRARDEKGRFAPGETAKAADAAPEKVAPAADTQVSAPGQAPAAPITPPSTAVELAPTSWTQDAKAVWATLPPAIQAAVIKREREVSDGFRQKSDELRRYAEVEQVLGPRRQQLASMGYQSDGQVINHLLTLHDNWARDPRGTIAHLARTAGVDLATLAQPMAQGGQVPQEIDPQFQPIVSYIAPQLSQQQQQMQLLAQQQQQLTAYLQQQHALQEQAKQEQLANYVASFSNDKPHFDRVRQTMARLVQAGVVAADDLNGAYEKAIAIDPDLSAEVRKQDEAKRAADQTAAEEKRRKEEAERVEKAKNAAGSVKGSSPSNGALKPRDSSGSDADQILQEIKEAARGSAGRV